MMRALVGHQLSSEEPFLPWSVPRAQLGVAHEVRSTLLTSSLRTVRERGLLDRYLAALPPEHHETLVTGIAGVWLPMDVGVAHYRAMDCLGFSAAEQVKIGMIVADRVHGTFLGTMVRLASSAGVTPWTAVGYSQKLYDRLFRGGGGIAAFKLGPKEARVELAGMPLADIAYWRNGMRGMYQAGCELFCTKAYVTELPTKASLSTNARIAWA